MSLPLVRKIKEEATPTMTGIVMKRHLGRPTERELLGGVVKPKSVMKVEDIKLLPIQEVEPRSPKMPKVQKEGKAPKTKPLYGMVDVRTM
jgi:hypothetical protein